MSPPPDEESADYDESFAKYDDDGGFESEGEADDTEQSAHVLSTTWPDPFAASTETAPSAEESAPDAGVADVQPAASLSDTGSVQASAGISQVDQTSSAAVRIQSRQRGRAARETVEIHKALLDFAEAEVESVMLPPLWAIDAAIEADDDDASTLLGSDEEDWYGDAVTYAAVGALTQSSSSSSRSVPTAAFASTDYFLRSHAVLSDEAVNGRLVSAIGDDASALANSLLAAAAEAGGNEVACQEWDHIEAASSSTGSRARTPPACDHETLANFVLSSAAANATSEADAVRHSFISVDESYSGARQASREERQLDFEKAAMWQLLVSANTDGSLDTALQLHQHRNEKPANQQEPQGEVLLKPPAAARRVSRVGRPDIVHHAFLRGDLRVGSREYYKQHMAAGCGDLYLAHLHSCFRRSSSPTILQVRLFRASASSEQIDFSGQSACPVASRSYYQQHFGRSCGSDFMATIYDGFKKASHADAPRPRKLSSKDAGQCGALKELLGDAVVTRVSSLASPSSLKSVGQSGLLKEAMEEVLRHKDAVLTQKGDVRKAPLAGTVDVSTTMSTATAQPVHQSSVQATSASSRCPRVVRLLAEPLPSSLLQQMHARFKHASQSPSAPKAEAAVKQMAIANHQADGIVEEFQSKLFEEAKTLLLETRDLVSKAGGDGRLGNALEAGTEQMLIGMPEAAWHIIHARFNKPALRSPLQPEPPVQCVALALPDEEFKAACKAGAAVGVSDLLAYLQEELLGAPEGGGPWRGGAYHQSDDGDDYLPDFEDEDDSEAVTGFFISAGGEAALAGLNADFNDGLGPEVAPPQATEHPPDHEAPFAEAQVGSTAPAEEPCVVAQPPEPQGKSPPPTVTEKKHGLEAQLRAHLQAKEVVSQSTLRAMMTLEASSSATTLQPTPPTVPKVGSPSPRPTPHVQRPVDSPLPEDSKPSALRTTVTSLGRRERRVTIHELPVRDDAVVNSTQAEPSPAMAGDDVSGNAFSEASSNEEAAWNGGEVWPYAADSFAANLSHIQQGNVSSFGAEMEVSEEAYEQLTQAAGNSFHPLFMAHASAAMALADAHPLHAGPAAEAEVGDEEFQMLLNAGMLQQAAFHGSHSYGAGAFPYAFGHGESSLHAAQAVHPVAQHMEDGGEYAYAEGFHGVAAAMMHHHPTDGAGYRPASGHAANPAPAESSAAAGLVEKYESTPATPRTPPLQSKAKASASKQTRDSVDKFASAKTPPEDKPRGVHGKRSEASPAAPSVRQRSASANKRTSEAADGFTSSAPSAPPSARRPTRQSAVTSAPAVAAGKKSEVDAGESSIATPEDAEASEEKAPEPTAETLPAKERKSLAKRTMGSLASARAMGSLASASKDSVQKKSLEASVGSLPLTGGSTTGGVSDKARLSSPREQAKPASASKPKGVPQQDLLFFMPHGDLIGCNQTINLPAGPNKGFQRKGLAATIVKPHQPERQHDFAASWHASLGFGSAAAPSFQHKTSPRSSSSSFFPGKTSPREGSLERDTPYLRIPQECEGAGIRHPEAMSVRSSGSRRQSPRQQHSATRRGSQEQAEALGPYGQSNGTSAAQVGHNTSSTSLPPVPGIPAYPPPRQAVDDHRSQSQRHHPTTSRPAPTRGARSAPRRRQQHHSPAPTQQPNSPRGGAAQRGPVAPAGAPRRRRPQPHGRLRTAADVAVDGQHEEYGVEPAGVSLPVLT